MSSSCTRAALAGLAVGCSIAGGSWIFAAPSFAGSKSTCRAAGYTYAGMVGAGPVRGVAATLTAVSAPRVASGHVAAWVGVGGQGLGPRGANEWLQAGLAAYPGKSTRLYYELMLPTGRRYVELRRDVAAGERHRLAIVETSRSRWQVRVDGRAASAPILLPGSHGAWPAVATAESWAQGRSTCNRYSYGFTGLAVQSPGGSWRAPARTRSLRTSAEYVIARSSASAFVAAAAA